MATHSVGKIFIELDLDPSRYMRSQQTLRKEATEGAKILEKNFKNLGIKSGATFDLMRAQAEKSFEAIKKSGRATTDDLIRAEKAKADKIKRINEEQFGHQVTSLEQIKKHWKGMALAATAAMAAVGASIYAAIKIMKESIELANEQEAVEKRLESVIRSTAGAAGYNVEQLKNMATAMQRVTTVGDEVILGGMSILATFKNIRGEAFERTTKAALDMSDVMQQDLKSSMVMLAKAMNDPIANLSAMTRAGVQFTQVQKDMIKELWESGKVMEAQNVILKEMESQFRGAATAARDTYGGAIKAAHNATGDLKEEIGFLITKNQAYIEVAKQWEQWAIALTEAVKENKRALMELAKEGLVALVSVMKTAVLELGFLLEGLKNISAWWLSIKLVMTEMDMMAKKAEIWSAENAAGVSVEEVRRLKGELTDLQQAYADITNAQALLNESNQDTNEMIFKITTALENLKGKLEGIRVGVTDSKLALDEFDSGIKRNIETVEKTSKATKELIENYDHLEKALEKIRQKLLQMENEKAWEAQDLFDWVMGYGSVIDQLARDVETGINESISSIEKGNEKIAADTKESVDIVAELWMRGLNRVQEAFADTFYDAMTGELDDLGDVFESFFDDLLRMAAEFAAKMTMYDLFGVGKGEGGFGWSSLSGGIPGGGWGGIPLVGEFLSTPAMGEDIWDALYTPGILDDILGDMDWGSVLLPALFGAGQIASGNIGAGIGSAIGGAIGSFVLPGIGTIIGSVLGSFAGGLFDTEESHYMQGQMGVSLGDILKGEYDIFSSLGIDTNLPAGYNAKISEIYEATFGKFITDSSTLLNELITEGLLDAETLTSLEGMTFGRFGIKVEDKNWEQYLETVLQEDLDQLRDVIAKVLGPVGEEIFDSIQDSVMYDMLTGERKAEIEDLLTSGSIDPEALDEFRKGWDGLSETIQGFYNFIGDEWAGMKDLPTGMEQYETAFGAQFDAYIKAMEDAGVAVEELGDLEQMRTDSIARQMELLESGMWQDINQSIADMMGLTDGLAGELIAVNDNFQQMYDTLIEMYGVEYDLTGIENQHLDILKHKLGLLDEQVFQEKKLAEIQDKYAMTFLGGMTSQEFIDWFAGASLEDIKAIADELGIDWNEIASDVSYLMDTIEELDDTIDEALEKFKVMGDEIAELKGYSTDLEKAIDNINESFLGFLDLSKEVGASTGELANLMADWVETLLKAVGVVDWDMFADFGIVDTNEIRSVINALEDAFNEMRTLADDLGLTMEEIDRMLADAIDAVMEAAAQNIQNAISDIAGAIDNTFSEVDQRIRDLVNTFSDLNAAFDDLAQAARELESSYVKLADIEIDRIEGLLRAAGVEQWNVTDEYGTKWVSDLNLLIKELEKGFQNLLDISSEALGFETLRAQVEQVIALIQANYPGDPEIMQFLSETGSSLEEFLIWLGGWTGDYEDLVPEMKSFFEEIAAQMGLSIDDPAFAAVWQGLIADFADISAMLDESINKLLTSLFTEIETTIEDLETGPLTKELNEAVKWMEDYAKALDSVSEYLNETDPNAIAEYYERMLYAFDLMTEELWDSVANNMASAMESIDQITWARTQGNVNPMDMNLEWLSHKINEIDVMLEGGYQANLDDLAEWATLVNDWYMASLQQLFDDANEALQEAIDDERKAMERGTAGVLGEGYYSLQERQLATMAGVAGYEYDPLSMLVGSEGLQEWADTQRELAQAAYDAAVAWLDVSDTVQDLISDIENLIQDITYSKYNIGLPRVRAESAQLDYETLKAAAMTGGEEEIRAFMDFTRTYLDEMQNTYKSSVEYQSRYAQVQEDLLGFKGALEAGSYDQRFLEEMKRANEISEEQQAIIDAAQAELNARLYEIQDVLDEQLADLNDKFDLAVEALESQDYFNYDAWEGITGDFNNAVFELDRIFNNELIPGFRGTYTDFEDFLRRYVGLPESPGTQPPPPAPGEEPGAPGGGLDLTQTLMDFWEAFMQHPGPAIYGETLQQLNDLGLLSGILINTFHLQHGGKGLAHSFDDFYHDVFPILVGMFKNLEFIARSIGSSYVSWAEMEAAIPKPEGQELPWRNPYVIGGMPGTEGEGLLKGIATSFNEFKTNVETFLTDIYGVGAFLITGLVDANITNAVLTVAISNWTDMPTTSDFPLGNYTGKTMYDINAIMSNLSLAGNKTVVDLGNLGLLAGILNNTFHLQHGGIGIANLFYNTMRSGNSIAVVGTFYLPVQPVSGTVSASITNFPSTQVVSNSYLTYLSTIAARLDSSGVSAASLLNSIKTNTSGTTSFPLGSFTGYKMSQINALMGNMDLAKNLTVASLGNPGLLAGILNNTYHLQHSGRGIADLTTSVIDYLAEIAANTGLTATAALLSAGGAGYDPMAKVVGPGGISTSQIVKDIIDLRTYYEDFLTGLAWTGSAWTNLGDYWLRQTPITNPVEEYQGGGIASGPESGYPAMLHGTEAVIPLHGGAIPVELLNGGSDQPINLELTINLDGTIMDKRIIKISRREADYVRTSANLRPGNETRRLYQ